jgi:hypothetical protein
MDVAGTVSLFECLLESSPEFEEIVELADSDPLLPLT